MRECGKLHESLLGAGSSAPPSVAAIGRVRSEKDGVFDARNIERRTGHSLRKLGEE